MYQEKQCLLLALLEAVVVRVHVHVYTYMSVHVTVEAEGQPGCCHCLSCFFETGLSLGLQSSG